MHETQQSYSTSITARDVYRLALRDVPAFQLLRWFIWLPLQSAEEIARCQGNPQTTIYYQITQLEQKGLLEHITVAEPTVPKHRRYYATDLGLYVYAQKTTPRTSVKQLAMAYQVRERDLLGNILRMQQLITLTNFISQVVAEAKHGDEPYELCAFKQNDSIPYAQRGQKLTFFADATITLARLSLKKETSFCLLLDTCEQSDTQCLRQQARLGHLLDLFEAAFWSGRTVPCPLIITVPERIRAWATMLHRGKEARAILLPNGYLTTTAMLYRGIAQPIWWPLSILATWGAQQEESLPEFEPQPGACVTFAQLLAKGMASPQPSTKPPAQPSASSQDSAQEDFTATSQQTLIRYVKCNFEQAAVALQRDDWSTPTGEEVDALKHFALLSLRLSALEKNIVALLARHPLLCAPDLAATLTPENASAKGVESALAGLLNLKLVETREWPGGHSRATRTRYVPTVTALRYLIERNDIPPAYYLDQQSFEQFGSGIPQDEPQWIQRGLSGLESTMDHTIGVSQCAARAIQRVHHEKNMTIFWWRSAREAVRHFENPESQVKSQIRPDAEIFFCPHITRRPILLFIEYDRATTRTRDYVQKFQAYSQYRQTVSAPPRILVITPDQKTALKIRSIAFDIDARLIVLVVLEKDFLQSGLDCLPLSFI